jgi:serine/threonine-protein kinase
VAAIELDTTALPSGATVTDGGRARGAPALGPGTVLAHFQIEALLGRGGMGEVYRATDLALDRPVALKVLPSAAQDDPNRRERMIREARAQARISDPHVCHIYYVGEQDGLLFFAMELVAGESLAERVGRGPLPPDEAIELVRQAALGLKEAWAHGFTHRDVKPSNLMTDAHGAVKLVDFGLVTRGAAVAADGGDTAATTAVGTPLYMAPEQGRGDAVDFRADIYALGATLHHLVSGHPPFAGDTAAALLSQHETALRPVLEARGRRGRVLALVDRVCARMMAKRPEDRFASYDELVAELDRISPSRTRPAGFWVRGFAATIDFMIAGFASVPLQLALTHANLQVHGAIVLFDLLILYATIATARWGRTIGRALLEIEVVSVDTGQRPTVGRAALRTVVEYGPIALFQVITPDPSDRGISVNLSGGTLAAIVLIAAIGLVVWAAWSRADKRALWDRVAGTMVRYRRVAPR